MSTLSLRKIKHDSSSVDNITLTSTGQTGFNTSTPSSQVGIKSSGANGLVLETDSADSTCSTRIFAKNDTYTGGVYFDNTGWNITTGSTIGSASGLSRLNITRDGYVKMPYQPAFCATSSGGYQTTSPIPFTSTKVNTGGHFSTSTYRFTAPISGRYIFILHIYFDNNNTSDGYPRFKLNGATNHGYAYMQGNGDGDKTLSMTTMIDMSANDYMQVTYTGTLNYYGGAEETQFTGYLIG